MSFRYALAPFIPFRDAEACARVRAIRRADITRHSNPAFRIEVIDDRSSFYSRFAIDIVTRIQRARRERDDAASSSCRSGRCRSTASPRR